MNKKIVVAEDDKDILFVLHAVLSDAGYCVEPLADGTSIVAKRKDWPDLFILDKDMPSIDGLAICKFLRLVEEAKKIPIIMISSTRYLKNKALEVGVDEFIEKPFELKHLLHVVAKCINRGHEVLELKQ